MLYLTRLRLFFLLGLASLLSICVWRPVAAAETLIDNGTVALLKDIYPNTLSSTPTFLAVHDKLAIFSAKDGGGQKLWRTDGTADGTQVIMEVTLESEPLYANGRWYFRGTTAETGTELWSSDGTRPGTQLVKDLYPGTTGSNPTSLLAFNGYCYFLADTPETGTELWKSDGTNAGTLLVKDINPGVTSSGVESLTSMKNRLYFMASENERDRQLWSSDGSEAGTQFVKELPPRPQYISTPFFLAGDRFFFWETDTRGKFTLWASDGTDVTPLQEFVVSCYLELDCDYPRFLINANGTLIFRANDGVNGSELWQSDGTITGTSLFKDFAAGQESSHIVPRTVFTDSLLVEDSSGLFLIDLKTKALTTLHGEGLQITDQWRAPDGTLLFIAYKSNPSPTPAGLWRLQGTVLEFIREIESGGTFLERNGRIYYASCNPFSACQLLSSDGTVAGTEIMEIDQTPGKLDGKTLAVVGDTLLLLMADERHGQELWRSDGTAVGTTLLRDLNLQPEGISLVAATDVNGTLFFITRQYGEMSIVKFELWKSDGSSAGTVRVKELPEYPLYTEMLNVDGMLYFTINSQLWRSDGSEAGTMPLLKGEFRTELSNLTNWHGRVYFLRYHIYSQQGVLWSSDGSITGTQMITSITPLHSIAESHDTLYFAGDTRLWQSTDTTVSLKPGRDLREFLPGRALTTGFLQNVGSSLFFTSHQLDNVGTSVGDQLWRKTSADSDPVLVKDFAKVSRYPYLDHYVPAVDRLFFTTNFPNEGQQLWISDSTPAGTQPLKTILQTPGEFPHYSLAEELTVVNNQLFFVAEDERYGSELWKSDGTITGTLLVSDINPGPNGSSPYSFVRVADHLIFVASDATGKQSLWVSDGVSARQVQHPTLTFGFPYQKPQPIVSGNRLYFLADDGTTGTEWWSMSVTTATTLALQTPLIVFPQHLPTVTVEIDYLNPSFSSVVGAQLTVTLPSQLSFAGSSPLMPTVTEHEAVWSLGNLAALQRGTLSLQLVIPATERGASFPIAIAFSASSNQSQVTQIATIAVVMPWQNFLPIVRQ